MVEDEPAESEEIEQPIILESAHRHGVSEEDMLQALRFATRSITFDKTTTWSCSSGPTPAAASWSRSVS